MKCKVCGKEQHYCTNCDSDWYMDNGYCDYICFSKTEKYKEASKLYHFLEDEIAPNLKHCENLEDALDIVEWLFY